MSPESSQGKTQHTSTSAGDSGDFQVGQNIFRENETIFLGLCGITINLRDKTENGDNFIFIKTTLNFVKCILFEYRQYGSL